MGYAVSSAPEEAGRPLYYYGLQGERQERDGSSLYGKVCTKRNLIQVKRCMSNRS
jgi:hypothetical protein